MPSQFQTNSVSFVNDVDLEYFADLDIKIRARNHNIFGFLFGIYKQ